MLGEGPDYSDQVYSIFRIGSPNLLLSRSYRSTEVITCGLRQRKMLKASVLECQRT